MKSLLLATATLVAATSGAFAADVVASEPAPVASAYNWTGVYLGAQAGYDWARTSYSFTNPVPTGSFTPNGFVGGLYVGYNYQFATPLVVGVEGDLSYSNVKGSFDNPFGGFSGGSARLRWQGAARVKVGYAFDRFLPYVAGGVAVGDFRFEGGPGLGSPFTPALESWRKTMTGWTIGAGVEYAFAERWTARLEYRYTDFGTAHGNLAPAYSSVVETMKVRDNSIRLGVSYRF